MNEMTKYEYYKFQYLEQSYRLRKEILMFINNASETEDIDAEILFGIISLESLNRGDFFTRTLERIGVFLAPTYLIKHDMSLGVGQVKISTAKKVLANQNDKEILISLIHPKKNIEIVAKLLSSYLNNSARSENTLRYLTNKYITGKENPKLNKEMEIYYLLLKWSVQNEIFKKSIKQYKVCVKNDDL